MRRVPRICFEQDSDLPVLTQHDSDRRELDAEDNPRARVIVLAYLDRPTLDGKRPCRSSLSYFKNL